MTTTAITRSRIGTILDNQKVLVIGLERIGWQIVNVEIDMTRETARIEIRRGSLLVTFDARNGRASTTREIRHIETALIGRRGDRCRVERLSSRFLGRTKHEGARSGLRWLCTYIADNASIPTLPSVVRNLFRGVMNPSPPQLSTATEESPT